MTIRIGRSALYGRPSAHITRDFTSLLCVLVPHLFTAEVFAYRPEDTPCVYALEYENIGHRGVARYILLMGHRGVAICVLVPAHRGVT